MKTNFNHLLILTMVFIAQSCSTGPGINKQEFFHPQNSLILPYKIKVDEESSKIQSGAIMGEGGVMQAFMSGGLGAVAVVSTPGSTGAIRGKFSAGQVFEKHAKTLEATNPEFPLNKLNLKLVKFQQYMIPGIRPGLKAFMEFEAYFTNKKEITRSVYAFDFKGKDGVLTPNDEKNMLNEMIHQSLYHWAKTILENRLAHFEPYNFPDHRRGDFSGIDVECTYEIFYR